MAKKTKPKKGKQKALQSKAQVRPPSTKSRPKPSAQVLPGMEQVRHVRLDKLCESIGDARDRAATAASDEKADKRVALAYMKQENVNAYQHAGIEILRVPGEEKLRVHVTDKNGATGSVPSEDSPDGEEAGQD